MTDVLLCQTPDDGEIEILGGVMTLTDDFRTAVYLSWFGGNEDDDGRKDNTKTWWGNLSETDPVDRYVSETQHLLQSLPSSSNNLRRLHDAGVKDLQWMLDSGAATEVLVEVTVPALNSVKMTASINGQEPIEFFEVWKAAAR